MPVSWKNGIDPSEVISRINGAIAFNDEGRVVFQGFEFREYQAVLLGMIEFHSDLPDMERRSFIMESLFEIGNAGVIDTQSVIRVLDRLEREYFRRKLERYVLRSSLSVGRSVSYPRIHLGRTQIIFDQNPNTIFSRTSVGLIHNADHSIFGDLPMNYHAVRVHISTRSHSQAAYQGLDNLDLIRGIWNWFYNRQQSFRMSFGGRPKPVNRIILGPIHTLHYPSGQLATDSTYWYEPNYLGPVDLLDTTNTVGPMYENMDRVLLALRNCPYGDRIRNAIIRYARALDERLWNNGFLRLWSVLEILTDTQLDRYAVTIRRASYVFRDRDYQYQVLEQLRRYRNGAVHDDRTNQEIEAYIYQLKNVVEALLTFHLFNSFDFASFSEACEFLHLPYQESDLERRARLTQMAMRYRGFG